MGLLSVIAIILSIIALKRVDELSDRLNAQDKKSNNIATGDTMAVRTDNTAPDTHSEQKSGNDQHQKILTESYSQSVKADSLPLQDRETENGVQKVSHRIEEKTPSFILWLKEDWLLKLGGVLVIMGVLFFLSLAFQVIGPAGKIAVGYLFGILLMAFGFWYAKKEIIGGSSIHLIGAIIIIISSYVAFQPGFEVFNAYFSMVMMFLTSVCVALTAFLYQRAELAHVGLFMAGLVPVLTRVQETTFFEILVYLAVVIAGVVWLAFVTRWRSLILMSLVIVILYSLAYITGGFGDAPFVSKEIIMVIAFGMLFFITSLFSILRTEGHVIKEDGIVALLNAGYALLWITSQAERETAPIFIATVGLIYAVGFFCVYKITNVYTSFLVYGGVALGMLTTAMMLEFSGRGLTATLLLMGAGVTFFTYHLSKDARITKIMSLFNLIPLWYVTGSIVTIANHSYPSSGLVDVWRDFLILLLAVIVYYSLYKYLVSRVKDLSYISLTIVVLLLMDIVVQALSLLTTPVFASELSLLIIGVGLTVFMYNFSDNKQHTEKVAFVNLLALIGVITSLANISDSISSPALFVDIWKDWTSVYLVMFVSFVYYFFFISRIKSVAYAGLASGLFLVATSIWQLSHLLIESEGLATFISILIYTIVGLYNLWKGSVEVNEIKIKISRIWLGLVAAKVIFIDAWQSGDVAVGVLICIVIGVLLLSSTFIIKKATSPQQGN